MPKWGVDTTKFHDDQTPWNLPLDLLKPAKTITDPIHGDVFVTQLEQRLIDSQPMQRLRRVRQLGTTHLVYPSATHSRFSHALGTMRSAQDLLDAVIDNRSGPRYEPDLLQEWDLEGKLDLRLAEATVLARLGGLLHDLCHVPLGHTIEDDLGVLVAHDKNEPRFERLWAEVDPVARAAIKAGTSFFDAGVTLFEELRVLIMSKVDRGSWRSSYPFVEDIVGNTICADLMDYLSRDHHHTGLPLAVGHRFANDFYVMGSTDVHYAGKMVIRISRHGQGRPDIVTELLKYLRYRYELTERVLTHHAKTSADAMIGKLLEMWHDAEWLEQAAVDRPEIVAPIAGRDVDRVRAVFNSAEVTALDAKVRDRLEREFTQRSDDGLLEYLRERGSHPSADERWRAIALLAGGVLDRRLFKVAARASGGSDLARAQETHAKFGSPEMRRKLEKAAADAAGVDPGWSVVIWLPDPRMRLKVAEVLVDGGEGVAPLDRVSDASKEIVKQHQALWAVSVYVEPSVRRAEPVRVQAMLSELREQMQLAFKYPDGTPVPYPSELTLQLVGQHAKLNSDQLITLRGLQSSYALAAAGAPLSTAGRFNALWSQAAEVGLVSGEPPDWSSPPIQ